MELLQKKHPGVHFVFLAQVYMSMIEDTMRSVKPYLEELLPHYPVFSYLSQNKSLTTR